MSYITLTSVITRTTLDMYKVIFYREHKNDTIATKDVFAKIAPTTEIGVYQDSPLEYIITARLTDIERITAYDLENDAEINDLELNGVHVDYVWIEKVEIEHVITENIKSSWVIKFYLVHVDYTLPLVFPVEYVYTEGTSSPYDVMYDYIGYVGASVFVSTS